MAIRWLESDVRDTPGNKEAIRNALARDVERFKKRGGAIETLPSGVSAMAEDGSMPSWQRTKRGRPAKTKGAYDDDDE